MTTPQPPWPGPTHPTPTHPGPSHPRPTHPPNIEVGYPPIAIWHCPEPGCDYRIDRPDTGRGTELIDVDCRAIARMIPEHYQERHAGSPPAPPPHPPNYAIPLVTGWRTCGCGCGRLMPEFRPITGPTTPDPVGPPPPPPKPQVPGLAAVKDPRNGGS